MDPCVLLNGCQDRRNWLHFYSSQRCPERSNKDGQGGRECAFINESRIHINDELMKRKGTLLEFMHKEGPAPLNSCQYLLDKTRGGHKSFTPASSFMETTVAQCDEACVLCFPGPTCIHRAAPSSVSCVCVTDKKSGKFCTSRPCSSPKHLDRPPDGSPSDKEASFDMR